MSFRLLDLSLFKKKRKKRKEKKRKEKKGKDQKSANKQKQRHLGGLIG